MPPQLHDLRRVRKLAKYNRTQGIERKTATGRNDYEDGSSDIESEVTNG